MKNSTLIRTTISLPEPIHRKGTALAKAEARSFSGWVDARIRELWQEHQGQTGKRKVKA